MKWIKIFSIYELRNDDGSILSLTSYHLISVEKTCENFNNSSIKQIWWKSVIDICGIAFIVAYWRTKKDAQENSVAIYKRILKKAKRKKQCNKNKTSPFPQKN